MLMRTLAYQVKYLTWHSVTLLIIPELHCRLLMTLSLVSMASSPATSQTTA